MPVTLKRRYKRRYIAILSRLAPTDLIERARERAIDMFGNVTTQKAFLRAIEKMGPDLHVIRCRSEYLAEVLCAITLIDHENSMVVMDISGTLRSLRSRMISKKSMLEKITKKNDERQNKY
jgi:RNase P/RNase MRP subunit POP5